MTKFIPALAFLLMAAPAFAQNGATSSPPSPNSNQSAPEPANSVPAGALTANPNAPQNPNVSSGVTTSTVTGQQVQPMAPVTTPAAPSGSTANNPSGAFQATVPTPAK